MLRWVIASFTTIRCQEMVGLKSFHHRHLHTWYLLQIQCMLFFHFNKSLNITDATDAVVASVAGVAEKHADNYEEDYLTDLLGRLVFFC